MSEHDVITKQTLDEIHLPDGVVLQMRDPLGQNYARALELANGNQALVQYFEALFCVVTINREAIPTPTSRARADALAQRIGRKGIEFVNAWFQRKVYPEIQKIIDDLPPGIGMDDPDVQEQIKNLQKDQLKNSLKIRE